MNSNNYFMQLESFFVIKCPMQRRRKNETDRVNEITSKIAGTALIPYRPCIELIVNIFIFP